MSISVTNGPVRSSGDERFVVTDVVLDSSYPTGGYAITPVQLGLGKVNHGISVVKVAGANGPVHVYYSPSTGKLLAYSATAEISNAVDLSAVTVQVTAHGSV